MPLSSLYPSSHVFASCTPNFIRCTSSLRFVVSPFPASSVSFTQLTTTLFFLWSNLLLCVFSFVLRSLFASARLLSPSAFHLL